METNENILVLRQVTKMFDSSKVVNDVSLDVKRGELFALLGPSGCGKTTTLRLVAGLERPDAGEINYKAQPIVAVSRRLFVEPHKRDMGMVFQSYAVWPNMTVFENVAYPLRARRIANNIVREKVSKVLQLVGLEGLEERPGPLLSGGQQQRVALARALVYEPSMLLLDEPFSNLDLKLREQMRIELRLLQRKLAITILFVTHDQTEALSLSDRVALMNTGKIEQVGSPTDIYEHPRTPFVRDFLGRTIVLRGKVERMISEETMAIKVDRATAIVHCRNVVSSEYVAGVDILIAIRPEDIAVKPCREKIISDSCFEGVLEAMLFVGDRYEAHVRLDNGDAIFCYLPREYKLNEGQRVYLEFRADRMSTWPAQPK